MRSADERIGGREREGALALAFRLALDIERQRRLGAEFLAGDAHERPREHGTRARMAVAQKYRQEFAIATECGFGRREPATLPGLLEIHAEAAGLR